MGSNWLSLNRLGITSRLMLWFLAISLIPCSVLTLVNNYLSVHSLERTVRSQLTSILSAKTIELDNFIRERRGNIAVLSQSPRTILTTEELARNQAKGGLTEAARLQKEREFLPTALNFLEAYGYTNIYLFAADSRLLYRVKSDLNVGDKLLSGPLKGTELAEVFERSKMLLQSEVSDYQVYPGLTEPAVFIAHPVLKEGAVIGVLVLQIGNSEIFRVFGDYDGLGETGETLVASRKGDQLTFVSPLRHLRDAAFHTTVHMGQTRSAAMQRAVKGERGYGQAIDYRGEPIVSNWSYVPAFRWGMLVKQDRTEAYSVIDRQRLAGEPAAGSDRCLGSLGGLVGGPIDQPADPRGGTRRRPGGRRRSDGNLPGQSPWRGRTAAPGDSQDDHRSTLVDRPDPAVERRADVHGHRDLGHVQAAGADHLRLWHLDQRGRGCRQRDLGHQPGAAQDHERGQPACQADHRRWPRPGRRAWAGWTGRCGNWPSRPARSARSCR